MRWHEEPVTWGQLVVVVIAGSITKGIVDGVAKAKGWW